MPIEYGSGSGGGGTFAGFADGTESLPGAYFTDDTNNGWWRPTTDTIALSTNGTERLRVTATGDLGLGKSSSIGAKLHIQGAASGKGLIVQANATTPGNVQEWQNSAGTALMAIDATGYLALGTTPTTSATVYVAAIGSGAAIRGNHSTGIAITGVTTASGTAIRGASTSGLSGEFYRNNSAPTTPVTFIHDDHASSTQPVLRVRGDGVQNVLELQDGTGNVLVADYLGQITAASDLDRAFVFGKARVFGTSDIAYFSHYDRGNASDYAIWQDASGNTSINCRSGTRLFLGSGGSSVAAIQNNSIMIGGITPLGKLHIDQSSTTGALPVIVLDQADVSEEFIRFIGTSAAGVATQSIVVPADASSPAIAGYIKIYVQDDGNQLTDQAYYIPAYTLT